MLKKTYRFTQFAIKTSSEDDIAVYSAYAAFYIVISAIPFLMMIFFTVARFVNVDARDIIEYFSNNKRYGITFKNIDKELVEFRTPNMTSNPTIMQNYITAFYYLLVYATSNKYNEKEVDAYIESFSKIYLLENYEISRSHKALKLSNMIFPHKKDQLYFMHQYLGK